MSALATFDSDDLGLSPNIVQEEILYSDSGLVAISLRALVAVPRHSRYQFIELIAVQREPRRFERWPMRLRIRGCCIACFGSVRPLGLVLKRAQASLLWLFVSLCDDYLIIHGLTSLLASRPHKPYQVLVGVMELVMAVHAHNGLYHV